MKTERFNGIYRVKSHRKPGWDYSSNGLYFLTLVTQGRVCNLGEIQKGEMFLSDYGKIVEIEWFKSFEIRKELILHEFIIMPNHLHAIVEIRRSNTQSDKIKAHEINSKEDTQKRVLESIANIKRNRPIRLPKSISSFIGGYKSIINTRINDYIDDNQLNIKKYSRYNHFFQSNYYDHIICDEISYYTIKNYIKTNPDKWDEDTFNKK